MRHVIIIFTIFFALLLAAGCAENLALFQKKLALMS